MDQLVGVAAAAAYSVIMTFALLKLVDAVLGLRVDKDEEREGLDAVLHGESGYSLAGSNGAHVGSRE